MEPRVFRVTFESPHPAADEIVYTVSEARTIVEATLEAKRLLHGDFGVVTMPLEVEERRGRAFVSIHPRFWAGSMWTEAR